MKAFIFKGETYIRLIPGKRMFQSTMVHEVVNRGDIFAMSIRTQEFTVIPGKSEVEHFELQVASPQIANQKELDFAPRKEHTEKLAEVRAKLAAPKFAVGDRVSLSWWTDRSSMRIQAMDHSEARGYVYQLIAGGAFHLEDNMRKA